MRFRTSTQQLLLSTVRIEVDTPEGPGVGTGFIFAYEPDYLPEGRAHFFLVTNRHIIEDAIGGWFTFIQTSEKGSPALGRSVRVEMPGWENGWWHVHPDPTMDIAVLSLHQLLEHEVEPGGPIVRDLTSVAPVRTMHVPTPADIENLDAIEEIFFIGYPDGRYDKVNLTPIVRSGITATPIQLDYGGDPIFLIDATVFPGSSGSPVFLAPNTIRPNKYNSYDVVTSRMALLGIVAAVFFVTEQGKLESAKIPTTAGPSITVKQMIDLGIVYKSSLIRETVEDFIRAYRAE